MLSKKCYNMPDAPWELSGAEQDSFFFNLAVALFCNIYVWFDGFIGEDIKLHWITLCGFLASVNGECTNSIKPASLEL